MGEIKVVKELKVDMTFYMEMKDGEQNKKLLIDSIRNLQQKT